MRKPRDYDSELKALSDKARQLKERKVQQLGELAAATGADATPIGTRMSCSRAATTRIRTVTAVTTRWRSTPRRSRRA